MGIKSLCFFFPPQQERKHIKMNKRERTNIINSGKSRKMKAREME